MQFKTNDDLLATVWHGQKLAQMSPAQSTGPFPPPTVPRDRRAQINAAIERYRSACGCELGSLFMFAATVLFLIYIAYGPRDWSAREALWRGTVWVVSCSVFGKLLGLAYARLRLHMLRSALRREPDMRSQSHRVGFRGRSFNGRRQTKGVHPTWP